jgi:hypothetical protein
MTSETHPIEKEQVMAYLDGELAPDQAARVAVHMDQCTQCQGLAADLRGVSSQLLSWNVEPAPKQLSDVVLEELGKSEEREANSRKHGKLPLNFAWGSPLRSRWAWASVGFVVLVVCGFTFFRSAQYALEVQPRKESMQALPAGVSIDEASRLQKESEPRTPTMGPMIARTASLRVSVKDFSSARVSVDRIANARQGYVSSLNLSTEKGAPQSLSAKLAIPAAQYDAALADLRALGRVEQEQQSSEEVSAQVVDLDARLKNARETEIQLAEILRTRTGKISDVLEVEREMARVRGEIERMEAGQKQLSNRVAFASIDLTLAEEYQAQFGGAPSSAGRRIRNALVDGYHAAADGLLGVAVFLFNIGPSLLVWALILFWPARWGWRRWQNSRAQGATSA